MSERIEILKRDIKARLELLTDEETLELLEYIIELEHDGARKWGQKARNNILLNSLKA